jgi:acyl-CoA synthetase (AMP-forming)/AMP-acid ligase II
MRGFTDSLAAQTTLLGALEARVGRSGGQRWLTLYVRDRVGCTLSYRELWDGAGRWAGHLRRQGVKAGDRVLLVLPTERAFYEAYWGILRAGAVPVPAYPPVRLGRVEEYLQGLRGLIRNSGARALVTSEAVRPLLRPVQEEGAGEKGLAFVVPGEVSGSGEAPGGALAAAPEDLALLQYTSGSTGSQKGVMLTHANLLANLRAIGKGVRLGPDDVAVSWLPLYHDMGLIGLMLGSLYWGIPLVALSPIDFLRRPVRWLRALSEHRGTVSAGPNFAYSLAARKIREEELQGIDLSAWRVALCGAEPIHPSTVEGFTRRFASGGFRPEAFFPAYGLAENTLAVSFADLGQPPHLEHVDARLLEAQGRAVPVPPGPDARTLVSVGRPLETIEVGIADEAGAALPEGTRGEVVVRGPSVMAGYYGNPDATAKTLAGGWLHTGDLGFFLDGRLYICGRQKDMVIKAGRNYFAEDLEAAAAAVPGVRPGGLAVFAVENEARGTEEVVLVAEVREDAPHGGLAEALRARVSEATGCRPDRIVLVAPHTLAKTSSGKIQRFKARQWYLDGSLTSRGGERQTTGFWIYAKAWLRDKLRLGRDG